MQSTLKLYTLHNIKLIKQSNSKLTTFTGKNS